MRTYTVVIVACVVTPVLGVGHGSNRQHPDLHQSTRDGYETARQPAGGAARHYAVQLRSLGRRLFREGVDCVQPLAIQIIYHAVYFIGLGRHRLGCL